MGNRLEALLPEEIERRSFEIIAQELGDRQLEPLQEPIVKRVIHTTADFDYADSLCFSPQAVQSFQRAVREGAALVTDTNMVKAGINRRVPEHFGCEILCFMADPQVAAEAKERGTTRAAISMEKASSLGKNLIFAIGNAPTALLALHRLMEEGKVNPALIIGVPVGFVHVVESKELILSGRGEYIVARGRKGGSNVAAAICNALFYQMENRPEAPWR